jgi:O-antigen/teichoic acid export membrane protein
MTSQVKQRLASTGISGKVLGSTIALVMVSGGFMLPGVIRTKFATLVFGAHGVAFIGQLSQIQTVLISLGAAGIVTATRVILARGAISRRQLRSTQNWLLLVPSGMAMIFALLVVATSSQLATLLLGSEKYSSLLIAAAAGIPPAVYGQISLAISQVRASRTRLVAAAVLSAVVGGGTVMALLSVHDEFWASMSFFGAPLAQALVIAMMCPEARLSLRSRPHLPKENIPEVLSLAWASAVLGIFAALADLAGRTVVVQRYGLEALAPYQPVVLLVSQLVGMLLSALATSSLIEVARIRDRQQLALKLDELTARLVPAIGGLLAIISGLTHILIVIFFNDTLVRVALPLVTLALAGEATRAYAWILGSCLLPQNLRRSWLLNGVTTVAMQLGASCIAGYFLGPFGLVIGMLVGNVFSAVFTLVLVNRSGISVGRRGLVGVLVIGLLLFAVPYVSMTIINFGTIILGVLLLALARFMPQIKGKLAV